MWEINNVLSDMTKTQNLETWIRLKSTDQKEPNEVDCISGEIVQNATHEGGKKEPGKGKSGRKCEMEEPTYI